MKKILIILALFFGILHANQRLIVLDPASIEIIYLLGAQDRIKGIATLQQSNIYPEEKTKLLNSVGTFTNPSIEKIIAIKPDLVILSSYSLNLEERLNNLGIKTLFLKAQRLDDIKNNVRTLGEMLGLQEKANEIIAHFNSELEAQAAHPIDKKALFLFATNPLSAFGKETIINDILELLGLHPITGDSDAVRPILSQEFIAQKNPDIILYGLSVTSANEISEDNALLKHTNAFKNDNLLFLQPHPLLRASPLVVEKIKNLRAQIEEKLKK